jgi:hypothetical protein
MPGNRFTSIAFLVAVLLFLLPFVDIKCNGRSLATNTGIGLALGTDYKTTGDLKSLENGFGGGTQDVEKEKGKEKENSKMYVVALAALLLGILGVAVSFMNARSGKATMVMGILAAIGLIVLMIQIKSDIKSQQGTDQTDGFGSVKVTAEFTTWYFLSLISFLAAAFFSYRSGQTAVVHPPVPANAPQLPIKNPGEQSEFPTSPSESEIG